MDHFHHNSVLQFLPKSCMVGDELKKSLTEFSTLLKNSQSNYSKISSELLKCISIHTMQWYYMFLQHSAYFRDISKRFKHIANICSLIFKFHS